MNEQSLKTRSPRTPVKSWKVITAASVGNALEWYDISVYAYFSVYISVAFFPSDSHAVSVMLALGTFALSFFIRPVGAIVLVDTRDVEGSFAALDRVERAGLPYLVVHNPFGDEAREWSLEEIRTSLDIDPGTPLLRCDARDPQQVRTALAELVVHRQQILEQEPAR